MKFINSHIKTHPFLRVGCRWTNLGLSMFPRSKPQSCLCGWLEKIYLKLWKKPHNYILIYFFFYVKSYLNECTYTYSSKDRCVYWVNCPTQEFFTHMETSPLPVRGCKFWPMLGTHGHWTVRFFGVPHLLWHGHPLIMVIFEDPWHSHLLPSV